MMIRLLSLGLFLSPLLSHATCISFLDHSINYSSFISHDVICENETFKTKRFWTPNIISLFHDYEKDAKKKLDKVMKEKNYEQVATIAPGKPDIREYNFATKPFYIYEKTPLNAKYCVVFYGYGVMTGIDGSVEKMDVNLLCDSGAPRKFFRSVTKAEVASYLEKNGNYRAVVSGRATDPDQDFTLFQAR
jgi:hypothetical protein